MTVWTARVEDLLDLPSCDFYNMTLREALSRVDLYEDLLWDIKAEGIQTPVCVETGDPYMDEDGNEDPYLYFANGHHRMKIAVMLAIETVRVTDDFSASC